MFGYKVMSINLKAVINVLTNKEVFMGALF